MTSIINTLVLTIDKVEKKTHKIVIVLERCPAAPDTAISNLVPARAPWPCPGISFRSQGLTSCSGSICQFMVQLQPPCRKIVEYSYVQNRVQIDEE